MGVFSAQLDFKPIRRDPCSQAFVFVEDFLRDFKKARKLRKRHIYKTLGPWSVIHPAQANKHAKNANESAWIQLERQGIGLSIVGGSRIAAYVLIALYGRLWSFK
jgi:hypothetical protein